MRNTRSISQIGKLETSAGLSFSRRNYQTSATSGESRQAAPDWKVRLSRELGPGSFNLDYNGSYGTSRREETRASVDSLGQPVDLLDESDETNFNNKAGLGWTSYSHTAVPVSTSAMGVGAEIFSGYYDNTDVALKIMSVMGIAPRIHHAEAEAAAVRLAGGE